MSEEKFQPALGIINAYNYWDEVVMPNWITFSSVPTARNAFNLSYSLWHVIEWIAQDERHGFSKKVLKEIQDRFISQCPHLGVMHDITTLGEHAKVSRPRGPVAESTAEFTGAVFYFSGGRPYSEHPSTFTVTLKDGTQWGLAEVFQEVVGFWERYFKAAREPVAK